MTWHPPDHEWLVAGDVTAPGEFPQPLPRTVTVTARGALSALLRGRAALLKLGIEPVTITALQRGGQVPR